MIREHQLEILSKSIDGETSEIENQELTRLFSRSTELQRIREDLISHKSVIQSEVFDSPEFLKEKILAGVSEEYSPVETVSPFRFPVIQWRVSAVAAILILTIGLVTFFGPVFNRQAGNSSSTVATNLDLLLDDISFARQQYLEAIEGLENLAINRLESIPTELAVVFTEELLVIDKAIDLSEARLLEKRTDIFLYGSLEKVYQAKIDLLTMILKA